MRKFLLPVVAIAAIAGASQADAATTTANFNAHVKLVAACVASATAMDFGTLPGLIAGTETAASTLTITCSKSAPYTLALSAGTGFMVGAVTATDKVAYSATLASGAGVGTGAAQTVAINGALSAQSTPSAQDYNEIRTVTVTY